MTADLPNIKVDECKGLLAAYVNDNDFDVVVRGLRNTADFVDEESMAQLHRHLYKKAETVFLISDAGYEFISSTMAKQVVGLGGDGSGLVPPQVLDKMKGKMGISDNMNALFILAIAFCIAVLMTLTAIVSRNAFKMRILIQENAMLEKRIRKLEMKIEKEESKKDV